MDALTSKEPQTSTWWRLVDDFDVLLRLSSLTAALAVMPTAFSTHRWTSRAHVNKTCLYIGEGLFSRSLFAYFKALQSILRLPTVCVVNYFLLCCSYVQRRPSQAHNVPFVCSVSSVSSVSARSPDSPSYSEAMPFFTAAFTHSVGSSNPLGNFLGPFGTTYPLALASNLPILSHTHQDKCVESTADPRRQGTSSTAAVQTTQPAPVNPIERSRRLLAFRAMPIVGSGWASPRRSLECRPY